LRERINFRISSTAYYIKFDGFSPTFFNQFPIVSMARPAKGNSNLSSKGNSNLSSN
jgi:hypothetical protein